MKKLTIMKITINKFSFIINWLLVILLTLLPFQSLADYNQGTTKTYLQNNEKSPWVTMALSLLNANNIQTEYLKSVSSKNAIDYAAPILAITALKKDPRTFGSIDYIKKLKSFYNQNQIGDIKNLNDDMFGILALTSSGIPNDDIVVSDAKKYILLKQNEDGGWGFSTSSSSDTNMTSAGIISLAATGIPSSDQSIINAKKYLLSAQNKDGGFPYDPKSSFGTASDSASTAWVIWALNSLKIDPLTWNQDNGNPINFLEKNQKEGGYFEYQQGSGEDAFSPNTTAYASIALSGNTLPINITTSKTPLLPLYSFRIEGSSGTICSGETVGPTALDIVKNASVICNFTYNIKDTSYGPYLNQIGNDLAEGLLGWMYTVNSELPSVGATDYNLEKGDFVLWHFGEFGWEPSENNTSKIDLGVTIKKGEVKGTSTPPSTIGFTLNKTSLDFGELKPGENSTQNFKITNTGNTDINTEAIVVGDNIFKENLKLNGSLWSKFKQALNVNQEKDIEANLSIPLSYTDSGQKQGTITIWAQ